MRRREFLIALGSAAAWPFGARAQQPERIRRIGYLSTVASENDPELKRWIGALVQGLQKLGWIEGRNFKFVRAIGETSLRTLPMTS